MPFLCDGADFDGTNDLMARGADLTDIADGKAGTFSCWLRLDGGDNAQNEFFAIRGAGNIGFQVGRQGDNTLRVIGGNAAGTIILQKRTVDTYLAGATWLNILCSWDLAATTSHLYVSDAAPTLSTNTNTDDTLDYTKGNVGVGALTGGGLKLNGCLAEVLFHTTYIDLSVEANRRKFIKSNGKPADLGADGSTPLGVQPLVYLHLDDGEAASDFRTNLGSGGNFTITGTLDTASTSPSDGQEPVADFSGTPLSGNAPLDVQFTDLTTNDPTSWSWDFGDSQTSTDQNPLHTYSAAGTYNVTLTSTSNAGSDAETKTGYVTASSVSTAAQTGAGRYKKKKQRKERLFRYSDFETKEAMAEALKGAIPIVHVDHDVPAPQEILEEEEDDELILKTISVMYH